jgi:hypothetical protein
LIHCFIQLDSASKIESSSLEMIRLAVDALNLLPRLILVQRGGNNYPVEKG